MLNCWGEEILFSARRETWFQVEHRKQILFSPSNDHPLLKGDWKCLYFPLLQTNCGHLGFMLVTVNSKSDNLNTQVKVSKLFKKQLCSIIHLPTCILQRECSKESTSHQHITFLSPTSILQSFDWSSVLVDNDLTCCYSRSYTQQIWIDHF